MKNNVMKRFTAVMVAGTMMFALVACGKPTPEKFKESAIKKLGATEIELDDLEDIGKDKDAQEDLMDDLEDGIVLYATGEDIEDLMDEDEVEEGKKEAEDAMDELEEAGVDVEEILGFDPSDWDVDDIQDVTVYAIGDNLDKTEGIVFEGANVIQFADKEKANEAFEGFATNYLETSEIELKELNKGEIVCKGHKVQFILNGDADLIGDLVADLVGVVAKKADMDSDEAKATSKEIKNAIKENINEDITFTFALYYDNGTLILIYGISMDGDLENISEIAKTLGVTDPTKVEMSDAMYDGFITFVDGSLDKKIFENIRF